MKHSAASESRPPRGSSSSPTSNQGVRDAAVARGSRHRAAGCFLRRSCRKPVDAGAAWAVTFWAGLRVAEALARWNLEPTLQWPNDLLLDGRKLCGILCVSRIVADQATLGCGIGINVYRPRNRPDLDEIVPPPIFLDDVCVLGEHAREELLGEILRACETNLDALHDPMSIAREWEGRAGVPGTRYRFTLEDGGEIEGKAVRLGAGGGLVIETGAGERVVELADRVRVVR